MAKLHELLAVEGDLDGVQKKIMDETVVTFTKKAAHFLGGEKTLTMFDDESGVGEVVSRQEMVTTVDDKLAYQAKSVIRYYDAVLQKETTNQKATAHIEMKDFVLAENVPATFLLGLETKLKLLRKVYEAIPTLPPGIKWAEDDILGENVYRRVHPEVTKKTAKTFQHKILVDAKFPKEGEGGTSLPAQIEKWEEDINVGEYTTETWSGMVTPTEKSMYLQRIDELIRAVKKARQRANTQPVVKVDIGSAIFNYINGITS
jgi:hypothetical protein